MRIQFGLGCSGVTVPANTSTATFIPTGPFQPAAGLTTARSRGELRVLIGTGEAQPALQFANAWDGSLAHTVVGTNITANGTSPPAAGSTDISANCAQYLLVRPGWVVKNTHASNTASMWLDGTIDVWGY